MSPAQEQPLIRRGPVRKWLKRLAVWLSALVLGALGVLVWALETGRAADFLREEIRGQLADACGLATQFDALKIEVLERQISLSDLELHHGQRRLLSVQKATAKIRILPLLYGRVQLQSVLLEGPSARLALGSQGVENLPACMAAGDTEGPALTIGLQELRMDDAALELPLPAARR